MNYSKEIEALQKRASHLAELMIDVKHPEFSERCSERNALSVNIEILK